MLASYPKAKLEDGQVESFHRSIGKRRASHQNLEYELEVRTCNKLDRLRWSITTGCDSYVGI
jgi:hypothetical protein